MRDHRYAAWIRQQDCALCLGPGPCHAHHHTEGLTYDPDSEKPPKAMGRKRGKGQKASDVFLIPLHLRCHKHVHEFTGPCSDWTGESRRAWQDDQVRAHRNRYAMTVPEKLASTARRGSSGATGWEQGANAERLAIADWLEETAARQGLHSAEHAALREAAGLLKDRAEPLARTR